MTMAGAGDCPYAETDTGARYVAGRLPEEEAEAFEAHLFACDRCFSEVRGGLEIKASASPRASHLRRHSLWRPLALAAALALVFVGVRQVRLSKAPPVEGVTRGREAGALAVTARPGEGGVEVSWAGVPRADVYRVEVSTGEGRLLLGREVRETSATLGEADLPAVDGALWVRVTALDGLRQEIAASAPVPIVRPPKG